MSTPDPFLSLFDEEAPPEFSLLAQLSRAWRRQAKESEDLATGACLDQMFNNDQEARALSRQPESSEEGLRLAAAPAETSIRKYKNDPWMLRLGLQPDSMYTVCLHGPEDAELLTVEGWKPLKVGVWTQVSAPTTLEKMQLRRGDGSLLDLLR